MPRPLGQHWLVDLIGCDRSAISTVDTVTPILARAVEAAGATPLEYAFHQFEPSGMSAVVLVRESHISIHSWPERGYVGADIFTCGTQMTPDAAIEVLERGFSARSVAIDVVERGRRR